MHNFKTQISFFSCSNQNLLHIDYTELKVINEKDVAEGKWAGLREGLGALSANASPPLAFVP